SPHLRTVALGLLAKRRAPLPRRAVLLIVNKLRQLQTSKLALVVGRLNLGIDLETCRELVTLIADSQEPEARQLVAEPFIQRLMKKGTSGLLIWQNPQG